MALQWVSWAQAIRPLKIITKLLPFRLQTETAQRQNFLQSIHVAYT
jgi:hypothetical protein